MQSLTTPYLLRYIAERGISLSIANRFCSEIRYNTNRTYYAIGFVNNADGLKIRSPYFKACIAPKAIKTISKGGDRNCSLFLHNSLSIEKQIASKRKKQYKSISLNSCKPKSKSINFLFWRHYLSRVRNSTRSLKPCSNSSKSSKSP